MQRHDNYYSDSRVRAAGRAADDPIKRIDTGRMLAVVAFEDDDGDEVEHEVPVRFGVCPTCEGRGSHVNPSVDCDGLTAEDFAEDPDFAEDYMGGCYDVGCHECHGERVVPVIDRDRADPAVVKRIDDYNADAAAYRAECDAERRFGC